ncbi:MAG: DUF2207 domain-containing protein [Candidatus Woesearchaeota archaeon]
MRERTSITIIVVIFLIIGAFNAYLAIYPATFNFHSAELQLQGNNVEETVSYTPNKDYHTLYRNFVTPIVTTLVAGTDSITITQVECSSGTSYYQDVNGQYYSTSDSQKLAYTSPNEYGCGFGANTGFKKSQEYTIHALYALHPKTIYEIKRKNYIKFVAYSSKNHPRLQIGKNFQVRGDVVSKKSYYALDDVILYIPFTVTDTSAYAIITTPDFSFDDSTIRIIFITLISLLPAIALFFLWYAFGKEYAEEDLPRELSQYPNDRKPWEVAAFFQPPFGQLDEHFASTLMMDFYQRKIIDIKEIKGDTYVKLKSPITQKFDPVEKTFLEIIDHFQKTADVKDVHEGYFNMTRTLKRSELTSRIVTATLFSGLQKVIKEKSKNYIDYTGNYILITAFFFITLLVQIVSATPMIIAYIAGFISIIITAYGSTLFVRYHKNHYVEYQKWNGFKNYLKTMESMTRAPPEAIVLWDKYLVYATALGVEKVVLDKFKEWKIITPVQVQTYTAIYATHTIAHVSGSSSGSTGGGFGGAASGGIGGGGGGGR